MEFCHVKSLSCSIYNTLGDKQRMGEILEYGYRWSLRVLGACLMFFCYFVKNR